MSFEWTIADHQFQPLRICTDSPMTLNNANTIVLMLLQVQCHDLLSIDALMIIRHTTTIALTIRTLI